MTAVRRARHPRAQLVAGAGHRPSHPLVIAQAHTDQIDHRVLHRHLDLLALPGSVSLHERGEDADQAVHAGARVADRGPEVGGRSVGGAGHAHGPAHRLGDGLIALVVAIGARRAEALDAGEHQPRIQLAQHRPAEAETLDDAGTEVLQQHVGRLQQRSEDFLAPLGLEVKREAALVGVEREIEQAVGVGAVLEDVARRVALVRLLDLDHVGAQPGQHLAARRPGLIVREIHDPNALQRLTHGVPLSRRFYGLRRVPDFVPRRGLESAIGPVRLFRAGPGARRTSLMPVITRQIGQCFAAEVDGIDMAKPLSAEEVDAIHAAMDRYAVLVFHDQKVDDEQQLTFTRSLGDIEHAIGTSLRAPDEYRLPTTFADVSNLDQHSQVFTRDDRRRLFGPGNRLWHSDSSFKAIPAMYSLLHARRIPSKGGNTEFADMRTAYDSLDAETKAEVGSLICEHSQIYSRQQLGFTDFTDEERARFAPVLQRLVRTHPSTGRRSLYLSSHAGGIVGWPVPEARAFLRDLVEHATQRQFVYAHRWRVGDLVMWDNRRTMHRARPFPVHEPRDMRRTTLVGTPTMAQVAATS